MFALNYPAASEHRRQHQYLFSVINTLGDNISENKTDLGSINALNSWFILHATIEDLNLGKFIKSKQPSPESAEEEIISGIDKLDEIRARLKKADRTRLSYNVWPDIEWLIAEVDQLRTIRDPE